MSGLFGTLGIALHSLLTQQGALRATSENISNLSTPGFSRRRPIIQEESPSFENGVLLGRGATLERIQSIRDRVLELRIMGEYQRQSSNETFVNSMSSVESMFTDSNESLGARLQDMFNSLNRLSTAPSDLSLRQVALTSASNLAAGFRDSATKLQSQFDQLDLSVTQVVGEINRLTESIARLNTEVVARTTLGEDPGPLEDQRTELIKQLSQKIDISVTDTPDGLTITTVHGEPLIVAGQNYQLSSAPGSEGSQHIISGSLDLTSDLRLGELGGLLRARDDQIRNTLNDLDEFAYGFGTAFNAAHSSGFDLNGTAGADFFKVPESVPGAASNLDIAVTDPRLIAASSNLDQGGNGNLLKLASLADSTIVNGQTPGDAYSGMVFSIGAAIANAKTDAEAGDVVLQQLENLRGSISGVSLDEEAADLVRFQRAYEAAARVISTVNEMLQTAVQLGRV